MINLYYDKIIEGTPAPNGAKEIALTKDARRVPYVKNHTIFNPISVLNTFYFITKANRIGVNLYTEKQKAKNLFYPVELADNFFNWDRPWHDLISNRAKRMIQKGHMKLLILAPKVREDYYQMTRLNFRINELIENGFNSDNIVLVIGEINGVYKSIFCINRVYGIDYAQIYTQLLYKTRWRISSLDWIFGYDDRAKPLNKEDLEKEQFDIANWKPEQKFSILPSDKDHDIALILELIYKNLHEKGNLNFDIEKYNIKSLNNNYIDPKKSILEKESKIDLIKNLPRYSSKEKNFNSAINIVCDEIFLNVDTHYKPELHGLSPGFKVWSQIAQGYPFLVIGSLDTMRYLNNEKYFSYNTLLNQDYDSLTLPTKRVEAIVKDLERLLNMDYTKFLNMIDEVKPFMEANRKRFLEKKLGIKLMNLFVDMNYE